MLKEKVGRSNIELSKKNQQKLRGCISQQESEENLKNVIADFFKNTRHKNQFEFNIKDGNDSVIPAGRTTRGRFAHSDVDLKYPVVNP